MKPLFRAPRVTLRAVLLALLAHAIVLSAMLLPTIAAEPAARAARLLAPGTLLAAADLVVSSDADPGATLRPLLGMRLRHAIAAGAPLSAGDVAPPFVIERNTIVAMRYVIGSLVIRTEGRALGSAVLGDRVPVMNLASKETVVAIASGRARVEIRP